MEDSLEQIQLSVCADRTSSTSMLLLCPFFILYLCIWIFPRHRHIPSLAAISLSCVCVSYKCGCMWVDCHRTYNEEPLPIFIHANDVIWQCQLASPQSAQSFRFTLLSIYYGQLKRYKDMLKTNMRVCDMQPKELEHITSDRSSWRTLFKEQVSVFEHRRIQSLQDKRVQCKTGLQLSPDRGFTCDICSRVCASRSGLISHQ